MSVCFINKQIFTKRPPSLGENLRLRLHQCLIELAEMLGFSKGGDPYIVRSTTVQKQQQNYYYDNLSSSSSSSSSLSNSVMIVGYHRIS